MLEVRIFWLQSREVQKFFKNNRYAYKLCIYSTFVISIVYALNQVVNLGFVNQIFSYIPLFSQGFGWVIVCALMFILSVILEKTIKKKENNII